MKPVYWILIIAGIIILCLAFLFILGLILYKTSSNQSIVFDSKNNQELFFNLVQGYFTKKDIPVEIDTNAYVVKITNSESNAQVSLTNIAQKCAKVKSSEWETIITTNLDQILGAEEESKRLLDESDSINIARDYLSIRIMEDNDSTQSPSIVSRVDLPGTRSVLVLDFPTLNILVPVSKLQTWGISSSEAFKIASQNIQNKYTYIEEVKTLQNGENIYGFSADHFFVTSYALQLEKLSDCIGKHGALVGIPTRSKMLCYPINDEKALDVVKDFMPAIYALYKEGPGSITPFMYYYHDGKYETIVYETRNNSFRLQSPDEFLSTVLR